MRRRRLRRRPHVSAAVVEGAAAVPPKLCGGCRLRKAAPRRNTPATATAPLSRPRGWWTPCCVCRPPRPMWWWAVPPPGRRSSVSRGSSTRDPAPPLSIRPRRSRSVVSAGRGEARRHRKNLLRTVHKLSFLYHFFYSVFPSPSLFAPFFL